MVDVTGKVFRVREIVKGKLETIGSSALVSNRHGMTDLSCGKTKWNQSVVCRCWAEGQDGCHEFCQEKWLWLGIAGGAR